MLEAFESIVDKNSRVLILGSMPGAESLRQSNYYAFPRNQFWKIIYELFNKDIDEDFDKRYRFILDNNIALWDVLKYCKREGSLDTNIKEETSNDFHEFFKEYPNIEYVFFNGTKSQQLFKRYIGYDIEGIKEFHLLPSTSPANTQKYDYKFEKWSVIKDVLM
ncbi:DNA-deoxyinosine glycosylase [Clostridium sp. D2Q-11]|uniref:DNA-deoxyinosine glycosylase n=1 Tax=Anaeromonas frigoriresistens TaxID=2683708 RepID=A0A942V1T7_9FIRM|nr:DNA-deoxyinosine glycosylase [Anaeromonas frigoriresistens]MBS4539607.1 DNA-deoxyinosine glycosylase [Anaeromonas frigoriresistens]